MKNVTFHVQYTLFGAPLILVLQHAVSKCVFFFFFLMKVPMLIKNEKCLNLCSLKVAISLKMKMVNFKVKILL